MPKHEAFKNIFYVKKLHFQLDEYIITVNQEIFFCDLFDILAK